MKGLLYKDFLVLKVQGKLMLLMIAIYVVLALINKEASLLGMIVCLFAAMMPITALSYDERAGFEKYALTMPVSRSQLVISKYLLSLALLGGAAGFNYLANFIFMAVFPEKNQASPTDLLIFVGIGLIYLSLIMPIMFKWGTERGRLFMIAIIFVPLLLFMMLVNAKILNPSELDIGNLLKLLPVIGLVAVVISIWISVGIYRKKEF